MNRVITLLASALTFGAFAAFPAQAETKVGFVYVGPPGDLGWTYRHDIGRQAVEALDGISTTALENVPEGPEAVEAITQLAETGHDLIFTTSFGFMDATNEVAGSYEFECGACVCPLLHVEGVRTGGRAYEEACVEPSFGAG